MNTKILFLTAYDIKKHGGVQELQFCRNVGNGSADQGRRGDPPPVWGSNIDHGLQKNGNFQNASYASGLWMSKTLVNRYRSPE